MTNHADLETYLATRRTVPTLHLKAPGPGPKEIEKILTIASRVPDHGKLAPWRFVVYLAERDGEEIGQRLKERWIELEGDGDAERLALEEIRFNRAPVVIGVISKTIEHKIPEWEQLLAAGAVCLNLMHAAHAAGYSAQWLSEWYSYDEKTSAYLGAKGGEKIAGFIHIGTPAMKPVERHRPNVSALTTQFSEAE